MSDMETMGDAHERSGSRPATGEEFSEFEEQFGPFAPASEEEALRQEGNAASIKNFVGACKHAGGAALRVLLTTDPRDIVSGFRQY